MLPTKYGTFTMHGYTGAGGLGHLALVMGHHPPGTSNGSLPLVRVHSECLTGDALGSWRCDCGEQLDAALAAIAAEGHGAVVYVRGHEGRGIGLLPKLRAYALQDEGLDTVDANLELGLPADARRWDEAAAILHDLGMRRIRLLTANPAKINNLARYGIIAVSHHVLPVAPRPENAFYLHTKQERMGHRPASAEPSTWQQLLQGRVPQVAATTGEDAELVERYGDLAGAQQFTIGQLGQSLDGFIAPRSGVSTQLTGPEDHEHLHRMRALVDCVVIGAATAIADDPRLTTRLVPGDNPVRVVLDPAARVQPTSRLMSDGEAPTLWCVGTDAPTIAPPADHVTILRLATDNRGRFSPGHVRTALRKRGYLRQLIEGGGRLVSAFLAAGELDRLYLTTAPILIGDGVAGISFHGDAHLAGALRAPTRRFQLGADVCTELTFTPLAASSAEVSDDVVRSGVPAP